MKKIVFGLMLIGALTLAAVPATAQLNDAHIYMDLAKSADNYVFDIDSVGSVYGDTINGVAASSGFYLKLYATNITKFVGFEAKISFDGTDLTFDTDLVTELKDGFTTMEVSPIHGGTSQKVVQYEGTSGTANDVFTVAHTEAAGFAGVDIGTTPTFLGRLTVLTGSGYAGGPITLTFSAAKALVDQGGTSVERLFTNPNAHNAGINGALPDSSTTVPVEMVSFTGEQIDDSSIQLDWNTASETNNLKFDVFRSGDGQSFVKIASVEGAGTTVEPQSYSYVDRGLVAGNYYYKLKQVDYNGAFTETDAIEVVLGAPEKTELGQNFPNPFNPTTTIPFRLRDAGMVTITLYNILGQEVRSIMNETMPAGVHQVRLDASSLSSGMYFYRLEADGFSSMKKLVILR